VPPSYASLRAVTAEGFAISAIPQRQSEAPGRPLAGDAANSDTPENVLVARCAQGDRAAQRILFTVRATYRHLRRQWKGEPPPEIRMDEGEPQADADPGANAEIRDRQSRALAILEKLSPKKRMVLLMHDLQGIEAAEIAKLVGAPVLTVRTRLFYARRDFAAAAKGDPALAEYFGQDDGAQP
jgi:hypothetical protein